VQARTPTHVVFRHKALALPTGSLLFGAPPAGFDAARVVPVPELGAGVGAALVRSARAVQLELHGNAQILVNGQAAVSGRSLALGDQVQLGANGPVLQLIVVE
jgi:hypothetical protein